MCGGKGTTELLKKDEKKRKRTAGKGENRLMKC